MVSANRGEGVSFSYPSEVRARCEVSVLITSISRDYTLKSMWVLIVILFVRIPLA